MPNFSTHLAFFRANFRGFSEHKASALPLIAANMVPLFGVVFFDWDAFSIVALYWVENVVVGIINLLKMIACVDGSKFFSVPLFALHYGFFCFIHGVLVLTLLGHDSVFMSPLDELREFSLVFSEQHLWWAIVALSASHLTSLLLNYFGRGEFRRTTVSALTTEPYRREAVLHIAILFGGWVATVLGNNIGVLALLVAGKTLVDLNLHLQELGRYSADQVLGLPEEILFETPSE